MDTFEELMNKFRNPGDEGVPATFADEIVAAHANEISIREAAIVEREEKIAAAEKAVADAAQENLRLKGVNYDLIRAAPKPGEPENKDDPQDSEESGGIDSLFEGK